MAVLQPQVCPNSLNFQPTEANRWTRSPGVKAKGFQRVLESQGRASFSGKSVGRGLVRRIGVKAKAGESEVDLNGEPVGDDYYSVLGVMPDATPTEIKNAYYNCMKSCHPDLSGNDTETTSFCMFVNEVYEVLSDPVQRKVYDEIHGYSLRTVNPFLDDSQPKDHVFVDEFSCIGCKNCANLAPKVFEIEEDFGRARAASQSRDIDLVQQAIDSWFLFLCLLGFGREETLPIYPPFEYLFNLWINPCLNPVDCIHWTTAAQLSLLEDEMRRMERVNVGLMLSNMGFLTPDVFAKASSRWEKRQSKVLERARIRMMKEKKAGKKTSYWDNIWSGDGTYQNSGKTDARERASRAAAAARKWREYSRKGVDRRPTCSLPAKKSTEDEQKEMRSV